MINEALRLLRSYHDLSQSEMSRQLGLSNSFVSELESGKKQPTLEVLKKYSDFFQIPVSSLLFFAEQIGKKGAAAAFQKGLAKQILSLLNWVDEKDERLSRDRNKPA